MSVQSSGRLEAEQRLNGVTREIDGVFLFQFFSGLIVRIGTILILLYLFNICVKEYRRVDRRHSVFIEVASSYLILQKPNIDLALLRDARKSIHVDDGTPKGELSLEDTMYAEKFVSALAKPLQEVSDAIKGVANKT